jgi:hypothetical protein
LPTGQWRRHGQAADSGPFHQALAQRGVKPVVQARAQWRSEPYRALPGNTDCPVPICYDEDGTVYTCAHERACNAGEVYGRSLLP